MFHQDNTRPHVTAIFKNKITELAFKQLDQPAYSADIAPSDHHLFRRMQNSLADVRFENVEEVRKWVDEWIAGENRQFFRQGIRKLPEL